MESMRIDKWLWASRFFKTRSIAQEAVTLGRVLVNGERAKPSRDVKVGDALTITRAQETFEIHIVGLSSVRGPAPVAQALYEETPESVVRRSVQKEQRALAPEPAQGISKGHPTKRDRRQIERLSREPW